MTYIIIATALVLIAAGVAKFVLHLNFIAIAAFTLLASLAINPLTHNIGVEIAKDGAARFNEYWNGYEVAAEKRDRTCTRDGVCVRTFNCDPYQVPVTKTRSVSDGKGGTTTETYTEMETRYHSCPYSKQETSYYVSDSLGDTHTIAANLMTGEQFRAGHAIPGGQVTEPPVLWTAAKARIDSGNPGPVTAVKSYDNYILASQNTLFKKYEGLVEDLLEQGLLPAPSSGVFDFYLADKVYNVDNALTAEQHTNYRDNLNYLNGAMGTTLYGDTHIVFAPANIAAGADDYTNAVQAYWQSVALGKNALSKNGVVLVLGVENDTVEWARSFTGMPVGNEAMIQEIVTTLPGAPLDDDLIGSPSFSLASETIKPTDGLIESILWGDNAFERVSMSGDGVEGAGFSYLRNDIQIGTGAYVLIAIVNIFLVGLAAGGAVTLSGYLDERKFGKERSSQSYTPNRRRYGY